MNLSNNRHWLGRICLFLLLVAGAAQMLMAQGNEKYANLRLENLAEVLKADYGVDCRQAKEGRIASHPLVVERDAFGTIHHIGFRLFPRDLMAQNPSPVYRFVERYLLELYQVKRIDEWNERLKEEKVKLRFYGSADSNPHTELQRVLKGLESELPFLMTTDNSHYTVLWRNKGKSYFSMRFPIQYELLWGMNKVECENRLYPSLLAFRPEAPEPVPSAPDGSLLEKQENGCYLQRGEWYELETVNSHVYYRATRNGYEPIFSERYPVESMHNLFGVLQGGAVNAHVVQRMYGRRKASYDLPLSKLLAFCRAEGCEAFTGIETMEKERITGSVVLLNRSMGYIHILYFEAPLTLLTQPEKENLYLEVYAYVPTHNLQSIYGEKNLNNKSNL